MDKNFASDNYSGCNSEVLDELIKANCYDYGYGADRWTKIVETEFKKMFECEVDTFLVFNGTGANVLGIEILNRRATAVLCPNCSHLITMEVGAMSKVTGLQPIIVNTNNGKIVLDDVKKIVLSSDSHTPQAKILTLAQTTELGSVYSLKELKEISNFCKENDIYLHIDGARISNALVSMGITPAEFIKEVKPDVLIFGGTKNGLIFGEAVLVFNKELTRDAIFLRKQLLQLASKSKFLASQFVPYLQKKLWYSNAKNANDMAKYMFNELSKIKEIEIVNNVDANIIFVKLPQKIIAPLDEFSHFYVEDSINNICRFVTNFDTKKDNIDNIINKIKSLLSI
jgi:threonine aldolase